jgi:hypothetical protein
MLNNLNLSMLLLRHCLKNLLINSFPLIKARDNWVSCCIGKLSNLWNWRWISLILPTSDQQPSIRFLHRTYWNKTGNNYIISQMKSFDNLSFFSQDDVDNAPYFSEVLLSFDQWIQSKKLGTKYSFAIVCDGPWDMGKFLKDQCEVVRSKLCHKLAIIWFNFFSIPVSISLLTAITGSTFVKHSPTFTIRGAFRLTVCSTWSVGNSKDEPIAD